ncbi:MAG: winged helix-turn-helix transcriptional regulator [Promethearchaeota archaeon]
MVVLVSVLASFGVGQVAARSAGPTTTRELVYITIEQNPGIHFRELCRVLDKQTGVIQYHLHVLEREERVVASHDGRYKRFFVAGGSDTALERRVASMLRRDTAGAIINLLRASSSPVNHGTLARTLGITSQAVTWNIAKLRDAGIVEETKEGRQKFYHLTDGAKKLVSTSSPTSLA